MTTWYYGRVSTDHQENSSENQRQLFEGMAAEDGGDYKIIVDDDVSGSMPLKERPGGKALWDGMRGGDTVVVARLDRGWRSTVDALRSLAVMQRIGVRLRILDLPTDLATDEGELLYTFLAGAAQYESRLRSRRIKDVFSYRRRNGLPVGRERPFGWIRAGDKFKVLQAERDIADRMQAMRDGGMSYEKIGWRLASEDVRRPTAKAGARRPYYGKEQIRNLLKARADGYPKVSQSRRRVSSRGETCASTESHAPQTKT